MIEKERGAMMVEAALVFPTVILTVLAMMIFGMMKFQETLVQFGTQKIATSMAKELSYPNYEQYLGKSEGLDIDVTSLPNKENVHTYFAKNKLYAAFGREVTAPRNKYEEELVRFIKEYSFLAGMDVVPNVTVEGFLVPMVKVEAEYRVKLPKFLGYIGLPDSITMGSASYAYASDPTEFVRNVDIAVDVTQFLLQKLGLDGKVEVFMEKLQSVMKSFD